MMFVKDLENLPSLRDASLIAGEGGLGRRVQGVNVLEAPDIAQWVSPGTVLLTSFYAIANHDAPELESFFREIAQAGIVALVFKVNRFMEDVPPRVIDLCEEYDMPLFVIERHVRYADVIMDILLPIINLKASLLDRHYRTSTQLAALRMTEHSLEEILQLFSEMLEHELTLQGIPNRESITTRKDPYPEVVVESITLTSENLEGFTYVLQRCSRTRRSRQIERLVVPVRLSARTYCDLVVHDAHAITDEHLVMLENMMRYLQVELLNQRNMDNMVYINKNNLVNELLTNVALTRRNLESILHTLHLDLTDRYQVVQVTFQPTDIAFGEQGWDLRSDRTGVALGQRIELAYRHCAYHLTTNRLAAIINVQPHEKPLTASQLKVMIGEDLGSYVAGISQVKSALDLHELMQQTQQVKDIQKALGRSNEPLTYDDLGIFKLFNHIESYGQILDFVPEKFRRLHDDNPTLFTTLLVYLQHGQNSHKAAEALFVHPKTINYRLGKVRQMGEIDIENSDDMLQLLFASKVFEKVASEG